MVFKIPKHLKKKKKNRLLINDKTRYLLLIDKYKSPIKLNNYILLHVVSYLALAK